MRLFLVTLFAFLLLCGCNSGAGQKDNVVSADSLFRQHDSLFAEADKYSDTIEIKYANGLKVEYKNDGVHVKISNPDPSVKYGQTEEFIVKKTSRRFICTTALQLGNFEILGLEKLVVGMNSLKNLFSPTMKQQMENGSTVMIGKEGNFDLETVIAAQPDYIFVSASKHGGFEALKECGIPLITHHGYKETNPLGQAEWIKLIGLLTGETRRANAVFADIERKYQTLQKEVDELLVPKTPPTVISGRQIRDGWYIVGGRSYMAQIFKDAGAKYLMDYNEDSGGVTLDFEAVYAQGMHADFWQTDGTYDGNYTLETLADEDNRYTSMDAYKKKHVIFCNLSQTPYRELAGVQPHILLADFVKAFHPEVLPTYKPFFYKLIK